MRQKEPGNTYCVSTTIKNVEVPKSQREKMELLACMPNGDTNQPETAQSGQSLSTSNAPSEDPDQTVL